MCLGNVRRLRDVADIVGNLEALLAKFLPRGLQVGRAAREDRHFGARARKSPRDRDPDALAAAGDYSDSVLHCDLHCSAYELSRFGPHENRSTVEWREQGDNLSVRFNIQNSILLTIPLLPRIIAGSTQRNESQEFSSGLKLSNISRCQAAARFPRCGERGRVRAKEKNNVGKRAARQAVTGSAHAVALRRGRGGGGAARRHRRAGISVSRRSAGD